MAGAVSSGCTPATLANAFVRPRVNDGERQTLLERPANGLLIMWGPAALARTCQKAVNSCQSRRARQAAPPGEGALTRPGFRRS